LSLSQMAQRTGIDRATISKLENGRIPNPTIGTLKSYASALGRRLTWRLEHVREVEPPSAPRRPDEASNRESGTASVPNPLFRTAPIPDPRRAITGSPRLTPDEICTRLSGLQGRTIESLTGRSQHRIAWVDPAKGEYEIEYESGNRIVVRLEDLYALYRELYVHGSLSNSYMKSNCQRILGWKTWNRPGSAMFAILPLVDETIRSDRGSLRLGA
jgi:transcriptional regulator with XRE-family HTH domain